MIYSIRRLWSPKIVAVVLSLPGVVVADSAVTINYGTVTSATTTTEKSKHAGGALAGGLLGAALGGRRHRDFDIAINGCCRAKYRPIAKVQRLLDVTTAAELRRQIDQVNV